MGKGLEVIGDVVQPGTFDFATLARLPEQIEDVSTLIPGRSGGGVRLRALLDAVQPHPEATHITLESTDGAFSASVPLAAVADAGVLVYRLGSHALPAQQGGPFRFLIAGVVACATGEVDTCANVKFVGRIAISVGRGRDTRPATPQARRVVHASAGDHPA